MNDQRSAMEKRMKTCKSLTIGTLLTAAGLLASVYTQSTQAAEAELGVTPATREDVTRDLDEAADLLADQQVVRAKNALNAIIVRSDLTDDERERVTKLLSRAVAAIKALDEGELLIQTAQASVISGELLTAERHAKSVLSAPKATNEQSERARAVLAEIATKRGEIERTAGELLRGVAASFESGRFAQSRATLQTIVQSGAALSADDARTVAAYQTRLVEWSEAGMASAGIISEEQPGVVKEREEPEPAKPIEPEVTSQPAKAPEPEVTSQGGPKPAAPSGDEMIRQSQRIEAQAILAEAAQAFDERRMTEAASKYARLKNQYREFLTAEQLQLIDNRLAECRAMLGVRGGDDALNAELGARDAIRSETLAVFQNYVSQANAAMDGGAWDDARQYATMAKVKLDQNRSAMSETEYQARLQEYRDLLAAIATRQESARSAMRDATAEQLEKDERERTLTATKNRERKINESLSRIRALQQEMKYAEAIQVCDNILLLDPINPSALTLREVLTDVMVYQQSGAAIIRNRKSIGQQSANNLDAMYAPTELVQYPDDWEQMSARRGGVSVFQESPENRRTLAELQRKKMPAKFKDNTLADVLNVIQTVTNVNMDVDWSSLEQVGVDKDRPVTLELTQVSAATILDRLMEKVSDDPANGAAWAVYDGVLTIESREQHNRKTKLQIYEIRDLLVNVPNFTNAPEFDLQQALQTRRGGGGGQPPFRQNQQNDQNQGPTIDERQQELIRIITENVDRDTWVENGGEVGKIQQFQGNLIITQTPNNHRMVDGLLADLRRYRAVQINVETRFLLVQQNWFEQIGLDLDVYFNAKNNQVRAARSVAPQASARSFFDFTRGGYQGGGVLPPAFDINRDGDLDDPNEQGVTNPLFAANPSPLSPIAGEQNSLGLTEGFLSGELASKILQSGPALGVAGQFMDDIQVDFLVKATQADTRSVSLTAPRITLMNGQISSFYVVTQRTFVSNLTPVVSDSAVGFDAETDVLSEGVTMRVEGTVSADRRYVNLNIDAAIAKSAGPFRLLPVTAVAGGQLVNSAETASFIELPTTTVTRVQTTVSVPDQGTILMGGQRLINEQEVETGVPVLSKIPFLNRFFTNRIQIKEEQTLLILVKPTVIIQSEQEEMAEPGITERLRTGSWK
jgi:type II secretory pathway component GspD/PulD (secretin)